MTDIERKILTIIFHYKRKNHKNPTYKHLSIYTGRTENEIKQIIRKLQSKGKVDAPKPQITPETERFMRYEMGIEPR